MTGKRPSKDELFVIGYKKKKFETGELDQWVESSAETTHNNFQILAAEERLIQIQTEASDDSTAQTHNPRRRDDDFVTQAQFDELRRKVDELAKEINAGKQMQIEEIQKMKQMQIEENEKMMKMILRLQAKFQKLKNRMKNKKKSRKNNDTESSTDTDTDDN